MAPTIGPNDAPIRPKTLGKLPATLVTARIMLTTAPIPTVMKGLILGIVVLKLLAAIKEEKHAPGNEANVSPIMMAANKVKGIRCGVCADTFSARMMRLHNDANMLSIGARVVGEGLALDIVDAFLTAQFEGGRHATRVEMIGALEG